ncbi:phosphotransferase [Microbulbifer epialgicus]|uniref:Phosphotransferase n=1 Tax=Microbulbifer epialgicus TaxID=393907 RepID=A0ABV4P411_9GAMM
MSKSHDHFLPHDWHLWSQSKPVVIKPLTGGQTNQTFLIQSGTEQLVLRINSQVSKALDLNRGAETHALINANHAGLCAPLVYADPTHRYQVTRFISGHPWKKNAAGSLEQLARLLSSIHRLPSIDTYLDVPHKINSYWASIDKQASFYSCLEQIQQKIPSQITSAKQLGDDPTLCHNDLSAGNLIIGRTGQLYAIDWEYAAMGDRFYDLAVIVEEHNLDRLQQQSLLEYYLGHSLDEDHWQRLYLWRTVYKYLCLLWYAVQWSTGPSKSKLFAEKIDSYSQDLLRSASFKH